MKMAIDIPLHQSACKTYRTLAKKIQKLIKEIVEMLGADLSLELILFSAKLSWQQTHGPKCPVQKLWHRNVQDHYRHAINFIAKLGKACVKNNRIRISCRIFSVALLPYKSIRKWKIY